LAKMVTAHHADHGNIASVLLYKAGLIVTGNQYKRSQSVSNEIERFIARFGTEGTAKLLKRMGKHIVQIGDCWLWNGAAGRNRYGHVKVDGRTMNAHRVMLCIATKVPWDYPFDACHSPKCEGQERCVNPEHVFWGSHPDNIKQREQERAWRAAHPVKKLPDRQWPTSSTQEPESPCVLTVTTVSIPKLEPVFRAEQAIEALDFGA
jgi:hypothetical protein